MKYDFKKIQELASHVPDIINQGQQAISAINSVREVFKSSGTSKFEEDMVEAEEQENASSETTGTEDAFWNNNDIVDFAATLNTPAAVASAIRHIVEKANETIQFCEEQETVRAEIRANADVEISRINAMADMVRNYLDRSFDERAGLFDNYFSVLDKALEKGDNTLVAQTLQSINSLAASSPFKDLADIDKVSALLAEGGEWDI